MKQFLTYLATAGPWVVSAVGTVLAWLLRTVIKELRGLKATQVKADLAYEEVSERVPSIKARYETWAAHR